MIGRYILEGKDFYKKEIKEIIGFAMSEVEPTYTLMRSSVKDFT